MPYSNLALDADRENGPAARSFAADAHDRIMVRIKRSYRIQVCDTKMHPMASSPRIPLHRQAPAGARSYAKSPIAVHRRSACSGVKALRNTSDARRQAAKLCYRFGPLTPSARSANLIAGDGTKNGFPAQLFQAVLVETEALGHSALTRNAPAERDALEVTFEVVTPGVIDTGQILSAAAALEADKVAAMGAAVKHGMDFAVMPAGNDDRGLAEKSRQIV